MLFRLAFVQITVGGCCDLIAQCSLVRIYHCTYHQSHSSKSSKDLPLLDGVGWKYRRDYHPFFLGNHIHKSINYLRLISRLQFTASSYLLSVNRRIDILQGGPCYAPWGTTPLRTALAASMVVNFLVTGLIVFKILKVFLELKATSVERMMGSLSSTGSTKLRHIIFMVIESGRHGVVCHLPGSRRDYQPVVLQAMQATLGLIIAEDFVIVIHQMFNVIIISVHFFFIFFLFYWWHLLG